MSFGTVECADLIVVRATATSGAVGWGEVTVLGGPYWSEESAQSVLATLDLYLFPRVGGCDVHGAGAVLASHVVRGNPFATSALDIALADLRARLLDIPVGALWGTYRPEPVPLSWSLASLTPQSDLEEADERRGRGFEIFKVKVGSLPLQAELARVAAIREAVGPDVSLRIDANQGWTRAMTGRAMPALSELDIAFVEQPLPASEPGGLGTVQRDSDLPIAADESLRTVADAVSLAAHDAARVFVYKIAKHGGFETARNIASVAKANSIDGYLGCMIESSIGTAAYLNFAASGVDLPYGCELFGPQLLADDLTEEPVEYSPGHVHPPSGPGLGVNVDAEKVARLAVDHRVFDAGN